MKAYLLRMAADAALAEDFMQEAFLRFLKTPKKPARQEDARKYLFTIATNLVRDHYRKMKRHPEEVEMVDVAGVKSSGSLRMDMQVALQELSARERQLLWLAYAEGFSHAEIAEITGLGVDSVRPLLFHARMKAAQLLRESGYGHPERKGKV